jgi:L-ascorbate metabolism protein UlaG (beta-lactamase superfamily)
MLPIGGHFTMGPEGAAIASTLLKVRTVLPMHFGTFPPLKGTPEQLTQEIKKQRGSAKVQALKPGETATF